MAGKVVTQLVIDGKNNSKKAFTEAESQLTSLSKHAKTVGAAIGVALAGGAFTSYIKESIDAIDKTDELAERVGIAAGEFAGLQYAAKFASVEGDALASTMSKFNQNIAKAAEGSAVQAKAFDTIGVAVRDVGGNIKSVGVLFSEVADQFAKLPEGPQKGALAIQLFGKQGAALIPLLNRGAAGIKELTDQAKALGLIMDTETYKAAGQFNDSLDALGSVSQGVGQKIAADLLPTLNDITGLLVDVSTKTDAASDAATVLGGGLKALATVALITGVAFKTTGIFLAGLMSALVSAANGDLSGAIDTLRETTTDYVKTTDEGITRIGKLWNGDFAETGRNAARVGQGLKSSLQDAADGMTEATETATKKMEELKAVQKKVVAGLQESLNKQTAAQRKANSDVAKLQDERLDIQKKYADTIAKLNGGGAGGDSFGNATALKVNARNALQAGDFEQAKKSAEAARQMLLDLQEAGQNSYGFAGLAKELQIIEESAVGSQLSEAEEKAKVYAIQIAALKADIDEIKNVDIVINLPPDEVAKILDQMTSVAQQIGMILTVQATVIAPDAAAAALGPAAVKGYAKGTSSAPPGMAWVGEAGPELLQFKGGERVFPAAASQALAAKLAGMSAVDPSAGEAAQIAAALPGSAPGRDLGRVDLSVGGESFGLLAEPDTFDRILKRAALKLGRTRR